MTVSEARTLVYELASLYFAGATVAYAGQSRMVKPMAPLVTLQFGSVKRPMNPPTKIIDGHPVSFYPASMTIQIDIYTKGAQVPVDPGKRVPMENTALNDMIEFANFLGSEYFVNWSHEKNVSLVLNGDVQDTTHLINDTSFQFRSTVDLTLRFTMMAVGYTGILNESSVNGSVVEPEFTQTASGGGTESLAKESIGYFVEAEIKEETENGK